MRDAFNRAVDQLEVIVGAWVFTHRVETMLMVIGLGLASYAYKMYVIDQRS